MGINYITKNFPFLLFKKEFSISVHYLCRYYAIHKEVYDWFDISFDEFGRTSTPQQTEICQSIFKKLMESNWLSERTMQQVFSFLHVVYLH